MDLLLGLAVLAVAAWGARQVTAAILHACRTPRAAVLPRPTPPRPVAGPPRPDPAQVRRVANAQARAFQIALFQLAQTPDFRRAASAVAAATAVPAAFRRRQFARFRPLLIAHVRRCRAAGADADVLAESLRALVTALGVASFEADYIEQAATQRASPAPRPPAPADRMAAVRQDHEARVAAIRQGVGEEADLRDQLLETEEQRYRAALPAVIDDRSSTTPTP